MVFEIKQAKREKTYLKLGIFGPSGSGKTYSSLLLAYGLTKDWSKICVIDTENGSGHLEVGKTFDNGKKIGQYFVVDFEPPFSPERYIEAINAVVESKKFDVLIIDSITHEWSGKGGILEDADKATGGFSKWKDLTPRHTAFIDTILQAPIHIIVTGRMKEGYALIQDDQKGYKIEKVGMEIVQRNGLDYELTLSFEIDINHNAKSSKDRTGIFVDRYPKPLKVQDGELILEWLKGKNVVEIKEELGNEFSDNVKKIGNLVLESVKNKELTYEEAINKIKNSKKIKEKEKEDVLKFINLLNNNDKDIL